ncbi:lipopolysaccharide heptosyltransferase II [Gilvimarinus sp. F26214L]|uniref:lipopolysaccharide heptosyltransferase II n=1 Tax=Gilvimarinus sp. DZF01 TaxID=3461371 RepID=UPI00404594A1
MPDSQAQQILIVGPSWVGDMVMAQSLFQALKQQDPDAGIHVLAPAWTRPLLDRMPEVSGSLDLPFGHGDLQIGARRRFAQSLRGRFQRAIVLPNSLKSALIPWFAGIPVRTGWRGEMRYGLLNDIRPLNKPDYPLMVERFVALAHSPGAPLPESLPIPKLTADSQRIPELLSHFGLDRMHPVLALCPGAEFGPAKRWPERHYAAVAEERIRAGWQVWIMGSQKDRAVAQAIIAALPEDARPQCHNLAGTTALADAIDLLSAADAVVSNDSGLMHVAAALGRPLVAVYGSTSPAFTPPLGEQVVIESIPVECGPCFKRECPLGHLKCLEDLEPKKVLAGLERLLEQQKRVAVRELSDSLGPAR